MSENLITARFVDPTELPLDQVWKEVAVVLKTTLDQIERLELWPHQIWVKLANTRAKFVSYRSLPLWIQQGLAAIGRCCDLRFAAALRYRASLDQLGEIFRTETQRYTDYYKPEGVQQWRDAWGQKAQNLRKEAARIAAEEERLKPIRAHQQAGREWHSAWQKVLYCCRDCTSLERLAPEIRHQSQEFADLPEVMQAMQQLWQQRWQELTQATA